MHPERVTFSFLALLVLVLSMLVKIGMGVMNRKLGTKLSSSIMLATSKDSFSDVFATLATTIALVMSAFSDLPMDGIMGNRGVSHDYAFRFWYCERYGGSAAWTAGR